MEGFLAKLTRAAPGDRLSPRAKLIIAASMGLNSLPSNIVLSQARALRPELPATANQLNCVRAAGDRGPCNYPDVLEFTQGPYIFEAYYKAPAAFIGAAGTFMGFYNMAVRTRAGVCSRYV